MQGTDRRRDTREDRRRSQGGVVPPSPALVRNGSKQRKGPIAGQLTPHSGAAHVNVPVPNRHSAVQQHPYANAGGYDYGAVDDPYRNQPYGRASPMLPNANPVPPALSSARARGGESGVAGDFNQHMEEPTPKPSLLRILTCRC